MSTVVLSRLKNMDLHASTAFKTMEEYMDITQIIYLHRYKLWTLSFDEETTDTTSALTRLLHESYYLINPNKEEHLLPEKMTFEPSTYWAKVGPIDGQNNQKLIDSIYNKYKIKLNTLNQYTVFEIHILDTIDADELLSQRWLRDYVMWTKTRMKGLLINPLYEKFDWIKPPFTDIEE